MAKKKMPQWSAAQHAKFSATMAAKAAAKSIPFAVDPIIEQSIPLDAIPERAPRGNGAKRKRADSTVQFRVEVDKHNGEMWLVLGTLRVPLVLR